MKKRLFMTSFVVVSLLLETSSVYANPQNPTTLPSGVVNPYTAQAQAGYIGYSGTEPAGTFITSSDTKGFSQGDALVWNHQGASWVNDGLPSDKVSYILSPVTFAWGPNKGQTGSILDYQTITPGQQKMLGYPMVADQSNSGSGSDIKDWVQALGGDQQYVDINKSQYQTTLGSYDGSVRWNAYSLPGILLLSGATLSYENSDPNYYLKVDSSGTYAVPAFKVIPTPAPTAQVGFTGGQITFDVGDKVTVNMTPTVYAGATNWHMEAVQVTGQGFSKSLDLNTNSGTYTAAKGTAFPYYGPDVNTLAEVKGGGTGDPSNGNTYQETATLDTTGMQPGTYTVSYTLYDAIGRAATSGTNGTITTTFTLQPAGTPEPTSTGSGTGSGGTTSNTMNLSIKFNTFTMPIPVGTESVPVTVSNDGDQDVTTDVTLTRNGQIPVPVMATQYDAQGNPIGQYIAYYNNVPNTKTFTQTVTIPEHGTKQLNISFDTGERMIGTNPNIQDDPQYTFQLVADVNKGHNPTENTYTDNETSMWIPTQGKPFHNDPPRIID